MKTFLFSVLASLFLFGSGGKEEVKNRSDFNSSDKIQVIYRLDDIGFCHSVNMAEKKLAEAGIPFSTSLMVCCPWYQEAVEILKEFPEVSVGVHLTLFSEWKNYRWGPVLGKKAVPSLVNADGHFFEDEPLLEANKPEKFEIEMEFRAQIDRALKTGLKIDYLDTHLGSTKETREVVAKLAKEYGLPISGTFGSGSINTYDVPYEKKKDAMIAELSKLEPGRTYLCVIHVGMDTPEMNALVEIRESGLPNMSKNREADLNTLLSNEFKETCKKYNIELITYRKFFKTHGLQEMDIQSYIRGR